ncbi:GUN4 domain-containing protein [Trichocoleus sp. FACHB-262]|uniref:GUN4 domain-containing protein n=1 Tax=Trichocoleus sp. FACHB-262 TaxID=2692869 RepID=UPI0016897601|nr:GUN4 domain-containing protein [Trichocoleus sp. FACHB-262]MBD2122158.1 GUN4 domain-containing protein [Trichocoleus sp. FACHB-262]
MTEAPEPKDKATEQAPLNEKIADLVLKVVMTGGVAGGGIGAFWSLFKDSDVPKAIASAVIGLGISYAAKMLQPVHEGNQRRLEKAGKAIDAAIDRGLAEPARRTIEDRYLECQALDCQALRSEGVAQHQGIFIPLLEEVFVPLEVAAGASLPGFRSLPTEITTEGDLGIWDFLIRASKQPTFRQIVILAWGGYGKTTLLKHIAYIYGTRQHTRYGVTKRVPVFLALRKKKFRDLLLQDDPPSLPELIANHHVPSLPGAADLQVSVDWVKDILKKGDAIVMLDGFDEVAKAQRPAVARWINEQIRQYGKSIFILTSRPKAYTEQEVGDRLEFNTPLWVQNFNSEQRQDFVKRWYLCQERYANGGRDTPDVRQAATQAATELLAQIEARQELKDLAKNPLLLNMIVTFHRRYPGADLPKRRVELYREICLLQLRDRPSARTLETLLTQCEAQTILQMLALEMMEQKQERIDRDTLLRQLTSYLSAQGETADTKEFLEQVVQISELLVEREPEEFEFAHLSFQEYLAATQIAQQQQESILYDHFGDDWWKPTCLLYAAQVKNPTSLIQEAINRGARDLAYACYQETTKRIDHDLALQFKTLGQFLQISHYQTLELYLANGLWPKADQETYRLMIIRVGKEEGQWFDREDLLNFPCEDLKAIDQLWVKYSNGKYGFSVQKQIYLECSGLLDGEYPGDQIWYEFCDRVGWRKNNKWVSRHDSGFNSMQALCGHLPRFVDGVVGGVLLSRSLVSLRLASRIVTCKI